MYADDAKQVVKATLEMSIFTLNVDATGYGDCQIAVEEFCRVGEEESKEAAKLMYQRNLLFSLMRRVHAKYPGVSIPNKEKVQSWQEYYYRIAEWEAYFAFTIDTDDESAKVTTDALNLHLNYAAKKSNNEFWFEASNDMSPFVKWFAPYTGNLQEFALPVSKPRKKKKQSENKKQSEKPSNESKKQKMIEQPHEREWHVNGISKTRWTLGDWTHMSIFEKDEYRKQRAQRGVWPPEIPLNERYIDDEGAFF